MNVILTPQKYQNIKHFSDLKITSLEIFVNNLLVSKGLHRRKNLKEAFLTLIKVSFAYSKMGYKQIGISSSTFQKLIICSKQTVFNLLNDIKQNFSHIVKIEKKLDSTGRYRNFFEVNTQIVEQLSDLLTEQEHQQIENLINQLQLNTTVEETLQKIKQDKNLTKKQLKKEIKTLLKQKEKFRQYMLQLFSKNTDKQTTYEEVAQKLKGKANNPDYIKAVVKLLNKGYDWETSVKTAALKYDPVV